jgi:hypothetical protein
MHTPPHRSHGWNNDAVTPDWPMLDATEVRTLLDRYPALHGGAVRIEWRSPRPFSAAARVHVNGSDVFVKRHHHRVRTPQALREEPSEHPRTTGAERACRCRRSHRNCNW